MAEGMTDQKIVQVGKRVVFPDDYGGMITAVTIYFTKPMARRDAVRRILKTFGRKVNEFKCEFLKEDVNAPS